MELLTPPGASGIAVVRVPPADRAVVVGLLCRAAGAPLAPRRGAPQRAILRCGGVDLDDVLVVDRGETGLELHLHGAPAVLDALDRAFGVHSPAAASPAAALLREALGHAQLDLALEQLASPFPARCEDLAPGVRAAALVRSRVAMAMSIPQRVVLAGRQNAGKSSLFNLLLFRERALTGPMPGLTRDPIAERTALAGYPYELVDTAGEGAAAAPVDAAAIARGHDLRGQALVVLVIDGAVGPTDGDRLLLRRSALVIASKSDLQPAPWPADVPCHARLSAIAQDAVAVRGAVGELLRAHRALPVAGAVGGFAALTPEQLAALGDVGDDCRPALPPA